MAAAAPKIALNQMPEWLIATEGQSQLPQLNT